MRTASLLVFATVGLRAQDTGPWIDRIYPLSGQRATEVAVELHGKRLDKAIGARFDTPGIEWVRTTSVSEKKVAGVIRVPASASLGPHIFHLDGAAGPTNSRLFNVTQFAVNLESEPNDTTAKAPEIRLESQSLQGYMTGLVDVDVFAFDARAGERWLFDLRSLEYGSHLECGMRLLDAQGRVVSENDDKDDYDESPLIEHTFASGGRHYLKLDQYRGPQGVSCSQNCGYSLEISRLPRITSMSPLGAGPGAAVRLKLGGSGLAGLTASRMVLARQAEHYRMTYPFTMPIRVTADPPATPAIPGRVSKSSGEGAVVDFTIPGSAPQGLWRVWVESEAGAAAAFNFEILRPGQGLRVSDGVLAKAGQEDRHPVEVRAGKPVRLWTLAAQLGLPLIDTVIDLHDASGKLVASHDDVMTGQGTPVGNPDSSLVYTPKESGTFTAVVRDRTGRGGPSFAYRLKVREEAAGFQILTSPENFSIVRGQQGELTLFLIREPGFEGEVPVRIENLPEGVTAAAGKFRADQAFGPSADGDNMIIPELIVKFNVTADAKPGTYDLRVLGAGGPDSRTVEAHTSLWIGPPRYRNDIRRPRPSVQLHVLP
ncbi:MAG: hypothetical protein FJW39_10260 [Acidobacteria bacterium]|nr:hypothetical protein [Acidobacteriota bacterium]